MIQKAEIIDFVNSHIDNSEYFLVDVKVSADNNIVVEIDNINGVDIDYCVELSRAFEEKFDREIEDYELEVGSAGLTAPFKVKGQYVKNINNEVEVLSTDGKKFKGVLTEVDDEGFKILSQEKVKKEGEKRPTLQEVVHEFKFNQVKYTKYLLQF